MFGCRFWGREVWWKWKSSTKRTEVGCAVSLPVVTTYYHLNPSRVALPPPKIKRENCSRGNACAKQENGCSGQFAPARTARLRLGGSQVMANAPRQSFSYEKFSDSKQGIRGGK